MNARSHTDSSTGHGRGGSGEGPGAEEDVVRKPPCCPSRGTAEAERSRVVEDQAIGVWRVDLEIYRAQEHLLELNDFLLHGPVCLVLFGGGKKQRKGERRMAKKR